MAHAFEETGRAISAIRALIAAERTGCLRVHVPGRGSASIHVLEGEVIGATTDRDAECILRRLLARGRVSNAEASALLDGTPTMADVERLAGSDRANRLMSGRFRDNLIDFSFDAGRFEFTEMETIRIPHIQLGHDSAGLMRELEMVHGRIAAWMGDRATWHISSGEQTPRSPQQRHIQALCTAGMTLDQLVAISPFFRAQTLVLVVQMIDHDSLAVVEAAPPQQGPGLGAVHHAIEMARADAERRSGARDAGLVAFADHERSGRGEGEGAFVGAVDRVDLASPPTRKPGLRSHAPALEIEEVVRRLGVCNEVLHAFVQAWNRQHGTGEGRRAAQLIVDTAPSNCAALFEGIEVDLDGRIGSAGVLRNLQRRPEAHRRGLAHRGFANLIDRTLTRGADGLDDAHLERMLSQVAGYRQRLGW